jgi:hypothetical protein
MMVQVHDRIRRDLREAMRRGIQVEARGRGLTAPAEVLEAVADDPGARGEEVWRLFGDRPPLALVAFDTPGIQEYVLKVRRPVDLLGGSLLVAEFTAAEEPRAVSFYRHLHGSGAAVPSLCVIYAGGGGGLMLVAASEAPGVAETLRGILARETKGALHTVVAVLEVWPADLAGGAAAPAPGLAEVLGPLRRSSRYAATVAALTARLGRERSRATALASPIPPERHIERCRACGGEVASGSRYKGGDEEPIGPACAARWRYGAREKAEEDAPRTFEDLVAGIREEGGASSIAVLYADGANAGLAFEQVESMAQHRALSLAVESAMQAARKKALAASRWLAGEEVRRVQTAIAGGDDLVLVLPAVAVFDVAPRLVELFEGSFDLEAKSLLAEAFAGAPAQLRDLIAGLGLGVGIAVAEFHFPIQFLFGYAYELLKSAKARIRSGVRSAIDFLVLRSGTPLSQSIDEVRERHAVRQPRDGEPRLQLTRRPYSRSELADLVSRARLLGRHVPPAQLHAIRREIDRGYALSRSLWRYQHARAKDGEGWSAYRTALGNHPLADVDRLLWQEVSSAQKSEADHESGSGPLATDFLDILEIFDLVTAEAPAAWGAAA